jgi:putative transposase
MKQKWINYRMLLNWICRLYLTTSFLLWLYLIGISTGDFSETLKHLPGPDAPGLSVATISRLKQSWGQDYQDWTRRDLSQNDTPMSGLMASTATCGWMTGYACWWSSIPMNTGAELVFLADGYRESAAS